MYNSTQISVFSIFHTCAYRTVCETENIVYNMKCNRYIDDTD